MPHGRYLPWENSQLHEHGYRHGRWAAGWAEKPDQVGALPQRTREEPVCQTSAVSRLQEGTQRDVRDVKYLRGDVCRW